MNTGQATYALPVDTIDLLDTVIRQNNGTTNQIDINISRISESTYMTLPNKLTQGRPIQVWVDRQSGQSNPTTVVTTANVSSTDTTITVSDVTQLGSSGFIQLDNEIITYPNVNTATNQLLNCFRGQAGTTAASHNIGSTVTVQNLPSVNVWPTPNAPGNQYSFVYYRMRRIQDAGSGGFVQDMPFRFIPPMVAGLAYQLATKLPDMDMNRIPMLKADYEQQFQLAADEDREKAPIRFVPRNTFYYN